jgi:hypothetical protein
MNWCLLQADTFEMTLLLLFTFEFERNDWRWFGLLADRGDLIPCSRVLFFFLMKLVC